MIYIYILCPKLGDNGFFFYNRTSNAHTLTVIHGILKQHAANQNKKSRKSRMRPKKVGKGRIAGQPEYTFIWCHLHSLNEE